MTQYVLRRLGDLVFVLFGVSVLIFLMIRFIPGDAVAIMLGANTDITPDRVQNLREQLGLHLPLHVQYWDWLKGVLRGDLGNSIWTGTPVSREIAARLPVPPRRSRAVRATPRAGEPDPHRSGGAGWGRDRPPRQRSRLRRRGPTWNRQVARGRASRRGAGRLRRRWREQDRSPPALPVCPRRRPTVPSCRPTWLWRPGALRRSASPSPTWKTNAPDTGWESRETACQVTTYVPPSLAGGKETARTLSESPWEASPPSIRLPEESKTRIGATENWTGSSKLTVTTAGASSSTAPSTGEVSSIVA